MVHADKVRGTLYGQGIGDALGIRDEFKSSAQIALRLPDGGPHGYERTERRDGSIWEPGDFSDDTWQALCILQSAVDDTGKLRSLSKALPAFARALHEWLRVDGRGAGSHTRDVMGHPFFMMDPLASSKAVWESKGQNAAANGAVMRTSVVGILTPQNPDQTIAYASAFCQATHFDPRCVASAVAVSVAIGSLVRGASVSGALEDARLAAGDIHPEVLRTLNPKATLASLKLDEGLETQTGGKLNKGAPIGFTYKATGAGFWALRELDKRLGGAWYGVPEDDEGDAAAEAGAAFRSILTEIIRAGGDTDTNAAVAGALMGAYLGLAALPPDLVAGLMHRDVLDKALAPFLPA